MIVFCEKGTLFDNTQLNATQRNLAGKRWKMDTISYLINQITTLWAEGWIGKGMVFLWVIMALLCVFTVGLTSYILYLFVDLVGREKCEVKVIITGKEWFTQKSSMIPITNGDPPYTHHVAQHIPAHGVVMFDFQGKHYSLEVDECDYNSISPQEEVQAECVIGRLSGKTRFTNFLFE